jgi:hypothetical protein
MKVHGVIEHSKKQFQKYFVPGKNTAKDESTVGFKGKMILKTYNLKKTKWGIRLFVLADSDNGLFVLADSDNGYVHSIIPYYGKLTGHVRNLPCSEKLFTSRIVL